MSQNDSEKPVYQTPIVVPLGEMAAAHGQEICVNGNSDTAGCGPGQMAGSECNNGITNDPGECVNGETARSDECKDGGTASGDCNAGGNLGNI